MIEDDRIEQIAPQDVGTDEDFEQFFADNALTDAEVAELEASDPDDEQPQGENGGLLII